MVLTGRVSLVIASAALAGCGMFGGDGQSAADAKEADFTSALQLSENRLARPPNVITTVDNALLLIGEDEENRLLPGVDVATLKREGTHHWLEVGVAVERAWDVVREFWKSEGFDLPTEVPEIGIVETDWRQDRAKVLGTGLTQYLDVALERVNDTGERYRFRTSVDRGREPGTTLIFISHRAIQEDPAIGGSNFKILPSEPTLEVEMLRRLMLRFRSNDESLASLEQFSARAEVNDLYVIEDGDLFVLRDMDVTWSRTRQALDRSGYTVVSSDRKEGTFTIKIADPTLDEEDVGFFDKLLGRDQPEGEPYTAVIALRSAGDDRTQIVVPEDENGQTILRVISANI